MFTQHALISDDLGVEGCAMRSGQGPSENERIGTIVIISMFDSGGGAIRGGGLGQGCVK